LLALSLASFLVGMTRSAPAVRYVRVESTPDLGRPAVVASPAAIAEPEELAARAGGVEQLMDRAPAEDLDREREPTGATPPPPMLHGADSLPGSRPDSPADTGPGWYAVLAGDTLSDIALRFETTVEALAQVNGLANPSFLRTGQLLIVPPARSALG
jgi:nucleoid-associated protein YgaU